MAPWRRTRRIFAAAALVLGLAEAATRLLIGPPVLYETDPIYEHRLRPGQDHRRFGHRILVNGAGMRSEFLPQSRRGLIPPLPWPTFSPPFSSEPERFILNPIHHMPGLNT